MKKKLLVFLIAIGGALGAVYLSLPRTAECAWCPTYTCYGSCAGDCFCLKEGLDVSGKCFSASVREQALEKGWSDYD